MLFLKTYTSNDNVKVCGINFDINSLKQISVFFTTFDFQMRRICIRMGLLTDMTVKYGEYKIQNLKEMLYLVPQNVRFDVLC
jgi:hypothetical protein